MSFLKTEQRAKEWSKGQMNTFRREGKIPAVIFGKGMDSASVFVNWIEFQKCYQEHGKVFEIEFGGKKETVNAKFIDTNPLGRVSHISFHKLAKGQMTTMKVPVTIAGDSVGAKAGGVIQQLLDTITVTALPKNIPDMIHVDVTSLEIGATLKAGDIKLPTGLTVDEAEADKTVVNCQAPQKQEEEPAAAADGEAPAAEAAATEAKEGDSKTDA